MTNTCFLLLWINFIFAYLPSLSPQIKNPKKSTKRIKFSAHHLFLIDACNKKRNQYNESSSGIHSNSDIMPRIKTDKSEDKKREIYHERQEKDSKKHRPEIYHSRGRDKEKIEKPRKISKDKSKTRAKKENYPDSPSNKLKSKILMDRINSPSFIYQKSKSFVVDPENQDSMLQNKSKPVGYYRQQNITKSHQEMPKVGQMDEIRKRFEMLASQENLQESFLRAKSDLDKKKLMKSLRKVSNSSENLSRNKTLSKSHESNTRSKSRDSRRRKTLDIDHDRMVEESRDRFLRTYSEMRG